MSRRSDELQEAADLYATKRRLAGEELALLMGLVDKTVADFRVRGLWPAEGEKSEAVDRRFASASDVVGIAKSITYRLRHVEGY